MTMMPEEYNMQYLVYSASNTLSEEEIISNLELHKVFRRMMFKRFDSYIEDNLSGNRP